jgi:hypothetical protein
METIHFLASFGDEKKKVKLSEVKGSWQVYVDDYFQGTLELIKGEWKPHLNFNSVLQGDDLMVLIGLVES